MSNSVNFKFGSTIEGKTLADGDFVAINKAMAEGAAESDKKYGSIYKGDKILGTTEADKLMTTEEITVTGVNVGNLSNGTVIPAGTDIMGLLAKMLAKELGVSATKPSAKLAGDSNATVEKGTVLSGKVYTATYTDGKYTGVSGYSYTQAAGCPMTGCTWSGVIGTETVNGNVHTMTAGDITVNETVTIKATIAYGAATNVPKTNFGNDVTTGLITASTAATGTITYTPSLKWWVGSSESKFEDMTWDSAGVRGLSLASQWVSSTSATVTFPKGAKQQVIAIPASKSFTAKDGAGSDITGTFNLTADVTVTCGGTHTESYKIYVAPANAGLAADSKATITLV